MTFWHVEKLVLFITVISLTAILLPISCHYVIKYHRELHQDSHSESQKLLEQRYGIISFYEAIVTMINMIVTPISMSIWIYCDVNKMSTKILLYISITLFNVSLFIVFILWIYRFWLIKFKMSFTSATAHQLWKNCINPNEIQIPIRYKFYLNFEATLGNIKWFGNNIILGLIILLMTAFYVYSEATFYLLGDEPQTLTTIFSFAYGGIRMLLWLILLIIYLTIPDFQDVWYVKKELQRLLCSLSILIWALFIADSVGYYGQFLAAKTKSYKSYGIPNAMQIVCVCCKFATIMISTQWVLRQLHRFKQGNDMNIKTKDQELALIRPVDINTERKALESLLVSIFEDEKQFELFLIYLSKEFRVKALLAFIEIVEFQRFVEKNCADLTMFDHESVSQRWDQMKFYDNIPRSIIVQENNIEDVSCEAEQKYDDERIQDIANELFEKYMEYGYDSPWSVEFKSRDYIDEQLGSLQWRENTNPKIIMEMFDDAANDIWEQLIDSFGRFEKTKEYKVVQKETSKYT